MELDAIEDLERRIDRLRSLYEQFFMGIERLPPNVQQRDVERRLQAMKQEKGRNTATRFRLNTVSQRYGTLQQYWARTMREIETGTYARDVLRAAQRFGEKDALTTFGRKRAKLYATLAAKQAQRRGDAPEAKPEPAPERMSLEPFRLTALPPEFPDRGSVAPSERLSEGPRSQRNSEGPRSQRVSGAPPPSEAISTLVLALTSKVDDQRIRQVYATYVDTKRAANESTAGFTYEKMARALQTRAAQLGASHPNRAIDFEVIVVDGQTRIKPVLK